MWPNNVTVPFSALSLAYRRADSRPLTSQSQSMHWYCQISSFLVDYAFHKACHHAFWCLVRHKLSSLLLPAPLLVAFELRLNIAYRTVQCIVPYPPPPPVAACTPTTLQVRKEQRRSNIFLSSVWNCKRPVASICAEWQVTHKPAHNAAAIIHGTCMSDSLFQLIV